MVNYSKAMIVTGAFLMGFITQVAAQASFTKEQFYAAMSSEKVEVLDQQLLLLKDMNGTDRQAYTGALTMKKAGYVSGVGKKLRVFKEGSKELEAAIAHNKTNAEYRFLRLMIQEHAPGILGYNNELETDSEYIRKSFKNLHPTVKQAIIDYSKSKSKYLKEKDLNPNS